MGSQKIVLLDEKKEPEQENIIKQYVKGPSKSVPENNTSHVIGAISKDESLLVIPKLDKHGLEIEYY